MSLTILSVAYPLAAVGPGAVGGAEQVLSDLDLALVAGGHRSIVVAQEGSWCAGELVPIARVRPPYDAAARRLAHRQVRRAVASVLDRAEVDLVHLHGIDFLDYLPAGGPPVLVTLHLPPHWYPEAAFRPPEGVFLHCVSASQQRRCPPGAPLLDPIPNGVRLSAFAPMRKGAHAAALGRICPEKGFHHAVRAARRAGSDLLLAGAVFPYPDHVRYFEVALAPLLDERRRLIGPVGPRAKRRLLGSARCLLVPSVAPETSSLVGMEALASGTPVIAFPSGALPELVEHGRTGFLVRDVPELAAAIGEARALSPADCRAAAEARFSADRMVERYLRTYEQVIDRRPGRRRPSPRYSHEIVRGQRALESLEAEWTSLLRACEAATPFQSPAWALPWGEAWGEGGMGAVAVRRGGALAGWLAYRLLSEGGVPVLRLAGAGNTDRLDALIDPSADAARVAAELGAALSALPWSRCELDGLAAGSPLLGVDLPATGGGQVSRVEVCPVLSLAGGAAEEAEIWKDVRYLRRRALREAGLEEVRERPDTADELLDALFSLHAKRWRARGEAGVLADARARRFQREAARRLLRSGLLRLCGIRIGGQLAGVAYGVALHRATYYYLGGFDPSLRRYSPGTLAVASAIDRAREEGCRRFDFLRGGEPYKYRWGARETWLYRRSAERPG